MVKKSSKLKAVLFDQLQTTHCTQIYANAIHVSIIKSGKAIRGQVIL